MLDECPNLAPLQATHWDVYRDLNKIAVSETCQSYRIDLDQLLVVDRLSEHVQSCLSNAILSPEYVEEDILGLPNPQDDKVRSDQWHIEAL